MSKLEGSVSTTAKEAETGFYLKAGGLNPGWEKGHNKTSSFLSLPSSFSTKNLFPLAPYYPITRRQTELE